VINVADYAPRFILPPFQHQLVGVERLVNHDFFGLFDEMGIGKSKQVIDAACILNAERQIDVVLVISPASVRGVWLDPEFGEIKKHCWRKFAACEFHAKGLRLVAGQDKYDLAFVVTNYEFVRRQQHREKLLALLKGHSFMMVLDESSLVKNHRAAQTKAVLDLGQYATRRVILNGTPITNSPGDLWPQLQFLSPKILPFRNYYAFRAQYASMGGFQGRQIVKWINLDDLQTRVAPYVIRREKKECLDLPPKLYTIQEVKLSESSWKLYKDMRDECVAWLDQNPSLAAQAGVKVMRLAQICAGFLGGFEQVEGEVVETVTTKHVGDEKLDCFKEWVVERLEDNPNLKIIVWCRFRKQLERVYEELGKILPNYKLYGGQSKKEREESVRLFSVVDNEPGLLCAQPQAGGFGLNLVGANTVAYLSNDHNLATRLQSEARVDRPGQTRNMLYCDFVATGPSGQRTVDHAVLKALRTKDELARWTASAWRDALTIE
jgi:Mesyanzhinovviridae DNA helicase